MDSSGVVRTYHDFHLVVKNHIATKLLNADNAAIYCAIFVNRFMSGEAVIPGPRFLELVTTDLRDLRAEGLELPGTTEERVAGWVRDGYLIRSVMDGRATEQYQLSVGSVEAVTYLQSLASRVSSATESTMSLMVEEILRIEADSNPDSKERVRDLRRQQAVLQRRIAAVESGMDEPINTPKIVERLNAVRALGAKMPTDVARYGNGIRDLDRNIRSNAEDDTTETYADILEALFDGEDALSTSEEGRTFQSFVAYLMNPQMRGRLSAALDNISRRDVTGATTLVSEMDNLIGSVVVQALEVKSLQASLNRSLRRFIQGREYIIQRTVRETLVEASRNAHAALESVNPSRTTGLNLDLRRADLVSIDGWRLKENFPSKPEPLRIGGGSMTSSAGEFVSLFPIDRAGLRRRINERVRASGGAVSCGEIVNTASAPLHLAEVAYICDVALAHGMRDPDSHEVAVFATATGLRAIELPYVLVSELVPESVSGSRTAGVDA